MKRNRASLLVLAFLITSPLLGAESPITVFGVLGKTVIEPVGAEYLTMTEQQGGVTRSFMLSFDEDLFDPMSLEGRSALLSLSPDVTPAPQAGVLHPVLAITLFPKLTTLKGTLKVNQTQ